MLREGDRALAWLHHLHLVIAPALADPPFVLKGLDPLALVTRHEDAPAAYRRLAGEALMATAQATAERIGAERITVPGYYPQVKYPDLVNDLLDRFWSAAGSRRRSA